MATQASDENSSGTWTMYGNTSRQSYAEAQYVTQAEALCSVGKCPRKVTTLCAVCGHWYCDYHWPKVVQAHVDDCGIEPEATAR